MNSTSQNLWIKFLSAILESAEPSHREAVRDIARLDLPNALATFEVMISSTIDDLERERDAADAAITALGLNRFRADKLGSLPYSPREICELMAKQCQLFILITGNRYGSLIEPEGISVVEFEYGVARSQNPGKILVYVKDGIIREQRLTDFLKDLEDFKRGYFRSLFTTPEELQQKILRDIGRWLTSQAKQNRKKEV